MMKDEDILQIARDRFKTIHVAESHIREAALEDIKFAYNIEEGQWDANVREGRENDNRPCLTANKLRKFISQVANRERDNRIAIKVRPVDDKSDPETARIYEDLIRNIEYQSGADEIYATAGEQAIASGFGYWRIITEEPDDGFEQEIKILPIENQFSVYLDPKENYGFIREGMTESDFREMYPDEEISSFEESGIGDDYNLWYEDEKVYIAEYFYKESYKKEIAQVLNPLTGTTLVIELKEGIEIEEIEAKGFSVLKTKKVKSHKVKWVKMTGTKILEKRDWVGKDIPIIQVLGDSVNIGGKTYKRSLIRDGKDPQRMYNYWLTSMTEKVALVPKAPFLVTPQEIKGFEPMWNEANIKNQPYLLYNAQGQRIPERQQPAQVDTGAMAMINIANNDIKDVLGMYESFIGEESNERSGRAILARQHRSDTGTYHLPDNLRRAVVKTGRIFIDIIPIIYDTERNVRLRNYEGQERFVTINETIIDEETGNAVIVNDLSVGKYDIQSDIRTYGSRRQETTELMLQTMQYAPVIAPLIADLVFKYMDAPGADEITERIKKYMSVMMQGGGKATPPSGKLPAEAGSIVTPPEMEGY